MQFLLVFITLLVTNIASGEEYSWEVQWNIEKELQSLNATCPPFDTCKTGRTADRDKLGRFNCHCTSVCARFGTCCLDSSHRHTKPPEIKPTCRMTVSEGPASDGTYFMAVADPEKNSGGGTVRNHGRFIAMQFLLVFVALLTINCAFGEDADIRWRIQDDLESLNATCPPYDTCHAPRISDSLADVACQCTAVCVQLGTCCLDSSYRDVTPPEIRATCRPVSSDRAYLMVDRCPTNSAWQTMCEEEWAGDSDVLKIVPVTSLFTLITYKNYFCFRCHETTDNFLYWQIELGSSNHEFDPSLDRSNVSPTYVRRYRTWAAPLGVGGTMVPVQFSIRIPTEIWPLPVVCERNLISHCADTWNDKDVIDKCGAYTGIISIRQNTTLLKYRNVHCAICNYEDLGNMLCKSWGVGYGAKIPFSFTHLLDVNRSDGDKVGKIEKCEGDSLWDPYAKKCRNLACALPGYVVKEGKCTPP